MELWDAGTTHPGLYGLPHHRGMSVWRPDRPPIGVSPAVCANNGDQATNTMYNSLMFADESGTRGARKEEERCGAALPCA